MPLDVIEMSSKYHLDVIKPPLEFHAKLRHQFRNSSDLLSEERVVHVDLPLSLNPGKNSLKKNLMIFTAKIWVLPLLVCLLAGVCLQ